MYEELVKSLHRCRNEAAIITDSELADIAEEAADVIEELSAIREEQKAQIILMAAEIEEQKPRWISVEERLPEEKTYVIILFDTIAGKMAKVSFRYKDSAGNNCWTALDEYGKNLFDWQPTHWMPLPEPPKEET